jgi:hypothetical protein
MGMKLLGVTNGKKVIASMAHHDFVSEDGMIADSGQPTTNMYGGYTRFGGGDVVWFQIPQTFAELYNDYNCNNKNRKYGVWNIEDVKILEKKDWPNCDSIEEKSEAFCWGCRGINGDEPLKYVLLKNCSIDHLKAIIETQGRIHGKTKEVIEHLISIKTRK